MSNAVKKSGELVSASGKIISEVKRFKASSALGKEDNDIVNIVRVLNGKAFLRYLLALVL